MLIDWFTVGAQILNFIVLVLLLRRFLYRPILKAIDAREQRIADQLADAQAQKTAAQVSREEFEDKNKNFDEQRTAMLTKATEETNAERERLLVEARNSGDALRATQARQLQAERLALGTAITQQVSDEVFEIARKTLSDLASVTLEQRMAEMFTQRLHDIDADARALLSAALNNAGNKARLSSCFELDAAARTAIQSTLNETFSADIEIQFEAESGACGIELNVGGQKLAWNITTYLSSLQDQLDDLLDSKMKSAGTDDSKAVKPPTTEVA